MGDASGWKRPSPNLGSSGDNSDSTRKGTKSTGWTLSCVARSSASSRPYTSVDCGHCDCVECGRPLSEFIRGDKQGKSRRGAQSAARRSSRLCPTARHHGGPPAVAVDSPLSPRSSGCAVSLVIAHLARPCCSLSLHSLPLSRCLSALFDERAEPPLSSPTLASVFATAPVLSPCMLCWCLQCACV